MGPSGPATQIDIGAQMCVLALVPGEPRTPSVRLCNHALVLKRGACLLAVAVAVVVAACSPAVHQAHGTTNPAGSGRFCVGLSEATGFCTSTTWAADDGVLSLPPGSCVRVTYTGDQADDQSVQKIETSSSCPHP